MNITMYIYATGICVRRLVTLLLLISGLYFRLGQCHIHVVTSPASQAKYKKKHENKTEISVLGRCAERRLRNEATGL